MPAATSELPEPPADAACGGSPVWPGTWLVVDFDLAGFIAGLGIDCGTAGEQEAVLAAEQQALAASPAPPVVVPGRGADLIPPGPALAAWLATAPPDRCAGYDLPDIAAGYRRLAAWAQAGELAAVAEMTSRTAIRRDRAGSDGQPVQVLPEAGGEVALALTLSQPAAMDWAALASRLRWHLPATLAAQAAGHIDLARARIIAEATAPLPGDTARAVQDAVLPAAGQQTTGQLRASVRRAVLAADPHGADQRREHAERHAKVTLYPDADGTATLTGTGLPGVQATAVMARITAMARAMKAAGHAGGLDYLRAFVMTGLLLGTPPLIPPPPGAPPDNDPPPAGPIPPDDAAPPDDDPPASEPCDLDSEPPEPGPGSCPDHNDDGCDAARDQAGHGTRASDADNPAPAWPPLPAGLPAPGHASPPAGPMPAGLLDVLLPWSALTGTAGPPAELGRLGPITPVQARELLNLATAHPATQWRLILTDDHGHAKTVQRLRRVSTRPPGQPRAGPATAPVIGRLTITIPPAALSPPAAALSPPAAAAGAAATGSLAAALLRAASRAAARLPARQAADSAAGGCAHAAASDAYRPPPRIRDLVTARDATCTFPTCRQPAWRTDLDHTLPWHHGGPTCNCNLGSRCRTHHIIKQQPGWNLQQTPAGTFQWTTPVGRSYTREPHRYPT